MKEIIFATTNPAKLVQFQDILEPIGINVIAISSHAEIPPAEEDGKTPEENARKKAVVYAEALQKTVFSMDNGLYFDNLTDEEQPGAHIRRIDGTPRHASDEEIVEYYRDIIERAGDTCTGYWKYAICIATPDHKVKEISLTSPRIFTKTASSKRIPGYPLASMQIDPETNRYIAEMTEEQQKDFWNRTIGKEVQAFFKESL